MKTLYTSLCTLVLLGFGLTTQAQTSDYPVSIGIFGGPVDFYGDLDSHTIFDFGGDDSYMHFGAGLDLYVNRGFDFNINLSTGDIGHADKALPTLEGTFTALDLMLKYKLNNGKIFKEDARIRPYITAGGGITSLKGDSADIYSDLLSQFAYGVGLSIPLSERISLDIRNIYRYTSSDNIDYINSGLNDNYMTLSAGLKLNLGKKKDADGDGISDKDDACPNVAGLESMMGCPDSDSDGIADKDDKCPNDAGLAAMMGCPDADGDGVSDNDDACPNEAGIATLMGCPDSDGDGVADAQDLCPNKAGDAASSGCPDSDGDGVADNLDECPDAAGTTATKGCPDGDGDGIADANDKCPEVAGVAANKGCPKVTAEVQELFIQALEGVKFESGRDVIKSSSYGILNNVVEVMNKNKAYKLQIHGHTDSQGDDAGNLDLSERRAAAVKKFLTDKGILAKRLTSKGFGESVPVADNGTAAGRAKNRRVEFKVDF